MNKPALIILLLLITGTLAAGFAWNDIEDAIFNLKPYNFTSYVTIPPTSQDGGSASGYYNVYGQGRNFNFKIVLPDAQDPHKDNEGNLLCYAKEGLNGTGQVNKIDITYDTISALLTGDFKKAIFNTNFEGVFNMSCAEWTGDGTFSSDNQTIPGVFKIDGPATDWEGTFNLKQDNNRIILEMNYIFYPNAQKTSDKIKNVHKVIYM